MFDHLFESSRWDDSNKWSNIGFSEEIGSIEDKKRSLSGALGKATAPRLCPGAFQSVSSFFDAQSWHIGCGFISIRAFYRVGQLLRNTIQHFAPHNLPILNVRVRFYVSVKRYPYEFKKVGIWLEWSTHKDTSKIVAFSIDSNKCLDFFMSVQIYQKTKELSHIF